VAQVPRRKRAKKADATGAIGTGGEDRFELAEREAGVPQEQDLCDQFDGRSRVPPLA
jgi:hypothetical protein